jgi:cyclophilin family peptidyl-prolyl cis-trans isomerase
LIFGVFTISLNRTGVDKFSKFFIINLYYILEEKMKRLGIFGLSLCLLLFCGPKEKPATPPPAEKGETKAAPEVTKKTYLLITVKDFGEIKIELFPDIAPKNVANIVKLAKEGFYNGLTFHRVVPDFVIQGGDPKGDGTGGPGYEVDAEISNRKHKRGTVAMARRPDMVNPERKSSGSQFYICLRDLPHLDNAYTIIGQVVQGMDVVDKIARVERGPQDKPVKPVVMENVRVVEE